MTGHVTQSDDRTSRVVKGSPRKKTLKGKQKSTEVNEGKTVRAKREGRKINLTRLAPPSTRKPGGRLSVGDLRRAWREKTDGGNSINEGPKKAGKITWREMRKTKVAEVEGQRRGEKKS